MEKCSFCVQKIQEGKLVAKREGTTLQDGTIKTACQKVCPSNAIHFGDKNDPNSRVSQMLRNERSYKVLEEVKTLPNVSYLTKVRNIEETKA
jgi:molybdopterin-containing oxidoreductase family iron-sulfur binding subunit